MVFGPPSENYNILKEPFDTSIDMAWSLQNGGRTFTGWQRDIVCTYGKNQLPTLISINLETPKTSNPFVA